MEAVEEDLRGLTVEVAEKMFGWRWITTMLDRDESIVFMSPQEASKYLPECILNARPENWRECWSRDLPDYAGDMSAAYQMEEKIKERGLQGVYVVALKRIVADEAAKIDKFVTTFDLIHASAEQRCRAALSVVQATVSP